MSIEAAPPATMQPAASRPLAVNLPVWVLAGAVLGVVAGLTFGERMAVLNPVGIAYSMMLESVIYPYILSSVIGGIGGLARDRAIRLFRASWAVYLTLWIIGFAAIFLLAQAIPPSPPPIEIIAAQGGDQLSLLKALIPSNVTAALTRNLVPAIVVFAVAFGVAVQSISKKDAFLESMEVVRRASLEIWGWVVNLAPIGVFALFASTAGTIAPAMADTLAVYIGLYLIGTGVLAFVVLPLLLSAIAPARARELLADLRPAFVLALVTTLPTSALPLIQRVAEGITARAGHEGPEANDVIRATISLSYVFAPLGNYFATLFVFYATHRFQVTMGGLDTALLPALMLLSCSGSPSTTIEAIRFVSEWLGLPASTVPLYVEAMTVTRYGLVALSVAAYAFATIAVPLVYFRCVQWRPRRMIAALVIGVGLLAGVAIATRMASSRLFPPPSNAEILGRTLDPALVAGVSVVVRDTPASALPPIDGPATVEGIRTRGVIRVGYGRDIVPFTYANGRGDLVGFDVSYAYQLARALHVRLELAPIDWATVEADLIAHRFDIIMAGAYVTDSRIERLQVTDSYLESPLALIVRSRDAHRFLSYAAIASASRLTLGVLSYPALLPMVARLFPNAHIVPLASYEELPAHPEIDAAVWSLAQARAWASAHPGYTAVAPTDMGAPLVLAYFLPPDTAAMSRFMNLWLGLQSSNGFRAAQIAYWINGERRAATLPRWNLLDNVLRPMFQTGKA